MCHELHTGEINPLFWPRACFRDGLRRAGCIPLCPYPFLMVALMLEWVSGEHTQGADLAENLSLFCGISFWTVHLSELASWTSGSAGKGEEEARPWHWGSRDIRSAVELDFEWQKPEVFEVERFHFSGEHKDGGSGWCMYYSIFNIKWLWGYLFFAI